jgi:hypothetical protein
MGSLNKNLTKQDLLMKSDGVKDCVKWLEQEIKSRNKTYKEEKANNWCWYSDQLHEDKAVIDALVSVKVSLEKYSKKLKHEADEL